MSDLKSKAKTAFDHNKSLELVHVTSDGQVFNLKTDAKLHAADNKLEDQTVTPFTRDEANDQETLEPVETLIPKIKAATSIEEIYQLGKGGSDSREGVREAADERRNEIYAFTSGKGNIPGII
jgi:hypothetical protein